MKYSKMSLKSIKIRFQVLRNYDPKNITIIDTSEWAQIKDKPAIIEITLPGETEPHVEYLNKNSVNYFNSIILGFNCDDCGEFEELDLPDGVYTITIKGSPDKFNHTLSYLKTDITRRELDAIMMKVNFCKNSVDSDLVNQIYKADFYIKSAEANVRHGNVCEAQELFFKAQDDIKKLNNCKSCF